MKPILYDPEGRPLRFRDDEGVTYAPLDESKFAAWDGSPPSFMGTTPSFVTTPADRVIEAKEPEIVAVEEQLSDEMLERAKKLKRLGGGPLYKAEKAVVARKAAESDAAVRMILDGIRRRPVL